MKKLFEQIIKFGLVGFLCFFIDYGIMVALTELAGINFHRFQWNLLLRFGGCQLYSERNGCF